MILKKTAQTVPWWSIIAVINLLLVIATTVIRYIPGESALWNGLKHFNLSYEMNVAVWWSSINLLLIALIAYALFSTRRDGTRGAWLIIAVIFTMLSWDELGSFHERISDEGWEPLLPFAIFIGLGLAFILQRLFRDRSTRRSGVLLLIGCGLLAVVPVQEYFQSRIAWSETIIGIRDGFEEGTELLGIFLCLCAVVWQYHPEGETIPLRRLIPNPMRMRALPLLLLLGGLLHTVEAARAINYTDIGRRGDPSVWYPSILFMLLCVHALQKLTAPDTVYRLRWLAASLSFGIASVGVVYLLPQPSNIAVAALAVLLAFVVAFYWVQRHTIVKWDVAFALGLALLLSGSWFVDAYLVRMVATGIFALGVVLMMLWRVENRPMLRSREV